MFPVVYLAFFLTHVVMFIKEKKCYKQQKTFTPLGFILYKGLIKSVFLTRGIIWFSLGYDSKKTLHVGKNKLLLFIHSSLRSLYSVNLVTFFLQGKLTERIKKVKRLKQIVLSEVFNSMTMTHSTNNFLQIIFSVFHRTTDVVWFKKCFKLNYVLLWVWLVNFEEISFL